MVTRHWYSLALQVLLFTYCLLLPPGSLAQTCGDGVAQAPEHCDDGNVAAGDGCSAICELENTSARCAGVAASAGTALDGVLVASGLSSPTHIAAPPLDPTRLFIVEKTGTVRVIKNGVLLATPFLDISSRVSSGPEQGLLSIAFHPNYKVNRRVFINFTDSRGNTIISRLTASATNPDVVEGPERLLLTIAQPFANHNGGQMAFGPDGFLYVGMGDGGGESDPSDSAQNDNTLLGKMLRFDVNRESPPFYNVPPSNPNAGAGQTLGLIWAKGLRNPWRFSFDRLLGDLYVADVGETLREEINLAPVSSSGGENYGWDTFEGSACFEPDPDFLECPEPNPFVVPVHEYEHDAGCAVTGGFVYRGCALPDLHGAYFYSDFCSAFVRSFRLDGGAAIDHADHTADVTPGGGLSIDSVTSFGEDARGELYVADQDGDVYMLIPALATDTPTPSPTPTATWTEEPTATATDTATAPPTDTATATPADTATPTPADTDTPEPTHTTVPTNTAVPATPTATFIDVTPTAIATPPGQTPCRGDVDGNGRVNAKDLAAVTRALFSTPGRPRWNPAADLNGNRVVDPLDLILILLYLLDPRC